MFPSIAKFNTKLNEFIEQLLSSNPVLRNAGDIEKLKANPWLENVNWEEIISRETVSPYLPNLTELDRENKALLDHSFDLEAMMNEIVFSQIN